MNIYRWDLKRNMKSVLIWTIVLVAIQFMYVSIYPSFASETELLTRWMKIMPKAFVKLFNLEDIDFSNILNYLAMVSSIYITLVGSVFAVIVGARSVSREEIEKTVEFLLTRPVNRISVVLSKFSESISELIIFDVVVSLSSLMFLNIFKQSDFDTGKFWIFWLSQIILHIAIMSISFLVGSTLKRPENAFSLSLGVMFVLYILNVISKLTEKAEFLKYFTPFSYSDASAVIKSGLEQSFLYFYALLIPASLLLSLIVYSKKDILV